jgi:hypothetical protein
MKTKLVNGVSVEMKADEAAEFERTRPAAVSRSPQKSDLEILKEALIAKGVITDEDLQGVTK